MNQTLTAPLAVHDSTTVCDQCGHEFDVTTDGSHAYARATGHGVGVDTDQFWRDGTKVLAHCPTRGDDPCGGVLVVDLATTDWTTHPKACRIVAAYAAPILSEEP